MGDYVDHVAYEGRMPRVPFPAVARCIIDDLIQIISHNKFPSSVIRCYRIVGYSTDQLLLMNGVHGMSMLARTIDF